jgi:hypothetical protein
MCTEVYYRNQEIMTVSQMASTFGYAVRELPVHDGYQPLDHDRDGPHCLCGVNIEQVAADLNLICTFDGISYDLRDRAEQPQ